MVTSEVLESWDLTDAFLERHKLAHNIFLFLLTFPNAFILGGLLVLLLFWFGFCLFFFKYNTVEFSCLIFKISTNYPWFEVEN